MCPTCCPNQCATVQALFEQNKQLSEQNKQLIELLKLKEHQPACEDITPAEEQPRPKKASSLPFLLLDKLTELGTYTLEEFDEKYHKAVKGGAPKLAKFLTQYGKLHVFDIEDRNKKEIFDELKDFFGDEMDFGYTNFTLYY